MSFTYRGTTSDSMFFNVTERQVYNAPAFDVNAIEVPGRSGDVLNSQQRFKNKTLVYTGFIRSSDFPGNTQWERLSRGLRNIKAWICGDAGKYHDLTDDYDPGFIRRAFVSGETAINILFDRPDGATITITFMAEPFMYEVSEPMELPETKSASGDIITITDGADNTPLKSAVVNIEPVQDLHGYDYPWPAGGGKQIYNSSTFGTVTLGKITCTNNGDGSFTLNADEADTADRYFDIFDYQFDEDFGGTPLPSAQYRLTGTPSGGSATTYTMYVRPSYSTDMGTGVTFTNSVIGGSIVIKAGYRPQNLVFRPMLRLASNGDDTFAPYSNLCPISGWSEAKVWVKPTYDTSLTPTATISLGQTVYGGTVDVVNGVLTVDSAIVDLGNLEWVKSSSGRNFYATLPQYLKDRPNENYICTRYKFDGFASLPPYYGENGTFRLFRSGASPAVYEIYIHDENYNDAVTFKSAMSEVQLLYPVTPIEVDLTPQTIKTLLGVNNIWANTGETEVEYIVPTENPTQWPSQPRLEITMSGAGTLTVNGKTWSIGSYTGTLICDSEIMDWYDAGALKNSLVSGDGFPELVPGDNVITYTGGITKVVATPRWRTL